ncbi:MAG: PqqD family peptide modification chaperone, partial [Ilumatobacteraceae bacterium]
MWMVDPNRVLSEVLDGEAVIVDLASGKYHAAAGVAATVWEGMLCGHSLDRIMDDVHRVHCDVPDDAEEAVRSFIDSVV